MEKKPKEIHAFPTTKEYYCGCTLRTGVLILGYLGVIAAILQITDYATQISYKGYVDISAVQINGVKILPTNLLAAIVSGVFPAILLYGVYEESRPAILSVVYIQWGFSICGFIMIVEAALISFNLWILPYYLSFFAIGLIFSSVEYSYTEELKEQSTSPIYYISHI